MLTSLQSRSTAVYAHSDILLLDDILSALDVQTARWICEKCLRGDIVRGRTVILVTHHIAMASSSAEFLVSLQGRCSPFPCFVFPYFQTRNSRSLSHPSDGRVKTSGSINETLKADPKLFVEEKTDEGTFHPPSLLRARRSFVDSTLLTLLGNEEIANDVDAVEGPPGDEKPARPVSDGKLILAEEKAQGRVSRQAIQLLVNSLGGFWFWVSLLHRSRCHRGKKPY
jgi:energy-coupling factor transporter ATP-binding protein EcfA2